MGQGEGNNETAKAMWEMRRMMFAEWKGIEAWRTREAVWISELRDELEEKRGKDAKPYCTSRLEM